MLNKISKKRLEKGEKLAWNSTIKAKSSALKKTPLKKVSDKQARLWKEAREECLRAYNHECFLCGAKEKDGVILHAHHYLYTRSQRPDLKYWQSNLCCLCSKCHNHHGVDKKFKELRDMIIELKTLQWENCFHVRVTRPAKRIKDMTEPEFRDYVNSVYRRKI